MTLLSTFKIKEYNDEVNAEDLDGLKIGEYGYKHRIIDNVVMPPYVTPKRYALSRTIETRPGDVCYVSYPKSGSTWLAYILVLIIHDGEIPYGKQTLRNCLHWVESSWTYPRSKAELEAYPSPRIFKSHMPYHMSLSGNPAENQCKYIYIARNPKDVVVSYYYFERDKSWSGHYSGSWDHWLQMFIDGKVQRGSWFDHVLSWWNNRHLDNILFLKYEDLRQDLTGEIEKIMFFLGYPIDDNIVEKIIEKTTFHNMQKERFSNMHEIEELNGFFRKGKVGSWKDQFTTEQSKYFDQIYTEKTEKTGLKFRIG